MNNKEQFFAELDERLKHIPEQERGHITRVYEELFQRALENGKNESQVVEMLSFQRTMYGDPGIGTSVKPSWSTRSVFAAIGMILFNLVFIVGPVIAIGGVLLALAAASFALLIVPLALVLDFDIWSNGTELLFGLFTGLTCFGLGLLLGLGTLYTVKAYFRLLGQYLRFNVRVVRGGTMR